MNSVKGMSPLCPNTWTVSKFPEEPLRNLNLRKSRRSGGSPRRSSIARADAKSAVRDIDGDSEHDILPYLLTGGLLTDTLKVRVLLYYFRLMHERDKWLVCRLDEEELERVVVEGDALQGSQDRVQDGASSDYELK